MVKRKKKLPTDCDSCSKSGCNTLYDLEDSLVCLDCVPPYYTDPNYRFRTLKLMTHAVTGEVNIERRRRAIEKRLS